MKKFDTRVYSVNDFIEWTNNHQLVLSPNFQRRSVWSEKAKSYLIDTVLCGKPIPKVLMTQDLQARKTTRIIIDGQQRLRSIIGFYNDEFKISKTHNIEHGGKYYSQLPDDVKNEYLKYEIGVDMIFDLSLEDTLDIFARLNTYSMRLNKQELLNASYLGNFKQTAYRLGHKYAQYWKDSKILKEEQIARMAEAELASETLILLIDGIQASKSIEKYYKLYEDEELPKTTLIKSYDRIMSWIGEIYPPDYLSKTNFKRIQLFYSLFSVIAHSLYGIKGCEKNKTFKINESTIGKIRTALDDISEKYDMNDSSKDIQSLIDASRRATTDAARRKTRFEIINKMIINHLG